MKKTQNENFRTENYNNQNLKLSEWAQQQKGKERGKISELEDRTIEIVQSEQREYILRKY